MSQSPRLPNLALSAAPVLLSLLRIVAGVLFMEHGLMKLLHFSAAPNGPA